MTFHAFLLQPFLEFGFMRRALVACVTLGFSCGPIGTLLVLRRMSLVGDATAHALLPGAAIGFVCAGLSLGAMSAGGFVAAILVAALAGLVARFTPQREDASFAAFYLFALAAGVMIISMHGTSIDLVHILFGSILAVDDASLLLIAGVSGATLVVLAIAYRPLIVESFDPVFLRTAGGCGGRYHLLFLVLVAMNLVAAFQALGTLMAVGLMMLPAASARFWASGVSSLAAVSALLAAASGCGGLLLSYHANLPSGPSIVLLAGAFYIVSLVAGRRDSILAIGLARRTHGGGP